MQVLFNVGCHGESVVIVWLNFVKGGTITYLARQYERLCNNKAYLASYLLQLSNYYDYNDDY